MPNLPQYAIYELSEILDDRKIINSLKGQKIVMDKKHTQEKQTKPETNKCQICLKVFARLYHLKMHERTLEFFPIKIIF